MIKENTAHTIQPADRPRFHSKT